MKEEKINPIEKASLWEIIGFPLGFCVGIICSITITLIIKGSRCIA